MKVYRNPGSPKHVVNVSSWWWRDSHDWRPGFPFNLHWPKWTGIINLGEKPQQWNDPRKTANEKKVGGCFLNGRSWKATSVAVCWANYINLYLSTTTGWCSNLAFQVGSDSRTEEAPTQIDLLPQVSLQVGNRRLILLMKEVLHHLGCIKPCE